MGEDEKILIGFIMVIMFIVIVVSILIHVDKYDSISKDSLDDLCKKFTGDENSEYMKINYGDVSCKSENIVIMLNEEEGYVREE